jgi:hypothetical protein
VQEDGVVGHQEGAGRHEEGVVAEVALEVTVVAGAQGDLVLAVVAAVVEGEDSGEAVAVSEGHNTSWGSAPRQCHGKRKQRALEAQRTCEKEVGFRKTGEKTRRCDFKMVYVLSALTSSSTSGSRLNRSCCVITVCNAR